MNQDGYEPLRSGTGQIQDHAESRLAEIERHCALLAKREALLERSCELLAQRGADAAREVAGIMAQSRQPYIPPAVTAGGVNRPRPAWFRGVIDGGAASVVPVAWAWLAARAAAAAKMTAAVAVGTAVITAPAVLGAAPGTGPPAVLGGLLDPAPAEEAPAAPGPAAPLHPAPGGPRRHPRHVHAARRGRPHHPRRSGYSYSQPAGPGRRAHHPHGRGAPGPAPSPAAAPVPDIPAPSPARPPSPKSKPKPGCVMAGKSGHCRGSPPHRPRGRRVRKGAS